MGVRLERVAGRQDHTADDFDLRGASIGNLILAGGYLPVLGNQLSLNDLILP